MILFKRIFALLLVFVLLTATACGEGTVPTEGETSSLVISSDGAGILPTDEENAVSSGNSSSADASVSDSDHASTDSSAGTQSSASDQPTDSTEDRPSTSEKTDPPVTEIDPLAVIAGGVDETEMLTGNLVATSVCTLRNLPVSNAVQRFFIVEAGGGIYIFTTQRSGTTTYLARCRYDPKTKYAYCVDSLTLPDYGHGESLEVRVRDDKVYVYVAGEANPVNSYAWGTEIVRFVYDKGNMTDVKRLTDLHCATKDGKPYHTNATTYRIMFSFNEESDRLLLYARCDTDLSGSLFHYFSSYRLSELDRLLDEDNGTVSLMDATSAFFAFHGAVSYKKLCPHGSFQGMDLCADGTTVYISGGAEGEQPQVQRAHLTENGIKPDELCNITEIYAARIGINKEYMSTLNILPEIESFQQFNGRFYVSFNPGSGLKKNSTEIFVLSHAS